MKKIHIIALSMILVLAYNCKDGKKTEKEGDTVTDEPVEKIAEEVNAEVIKFSMQPKSDSNVQGEVVFTEENGMVMMKATLSDLSAGEHAIHIHEKADCSSDDGKSSGGHWNPTHEPHGKWGAAEGYHKGDIGNFTADADGNAVGVLSELDCIQAVLTALYNEGDPERALVCDVMSTDLATCGPQDSIVEVAQSMLSSRQRRRPVLEDGKLVGQVSSSNILWALMEHSRRKIHGPQS